MDRFQPPAAARLGITPALEAGDAAFIAGFSRGGAAGSWPGQPVVPSPWVTCAGGCCLVLVPACAGVDTAGQWLRFLIAEFLADQHRVDGQIVVPGVMGRHPVLLIVEAGAVFEGDLGDGPGSGTMTSVPARSLSKRHHYDDRTAHVLPEQAPSTY